MSPFKVRFKFVRQRSRILAIAAVALVAAGVAIAVGHPQEVPEPILGNEWQCSRTVLLVTTCVPVGEQNGPLPKDAALADLTDGRAPSAIAVARPPRGQMDRSQYIRRHRHGSDVQPLPSERFELLARRR
jgi:hypothetical protein